MTSSNMDRITDLWTNDNGFRTALRSDAEGTLAAHGISLSAEERQALVNLDVSNLTDAQLQERVSMKGGC